MNNDKEPSFIKFNSSCDEVKAGEAFIKLEDMPDGQLYANILLKLKIFDTRKKEAGLTGLKHETPYAPALLARLTRHNVAVVKEALIHFERLGLVEVKTYLSMLYPSSEVSEEARRSD